jgi:hypothetical protein
VECLELDLDPVQPAGVGGHVDQLDVVGLGPVAGSGVDLGREVRAVVVHHGGGAGLWWVEGAQIAGELHERGTVLFHLDVAVELVLVEVVGGHEVSDTVVAGGGGPPASPSVKCFFC